MEKSDISSFGLTSTENRAAQKAALHLIGLIKRSQKDGLLSLDSKETYSGLPFLVRLGIKMAITGTDPNVLFGVLQNFILADQNTGLKFAYDWLSISFIPVLQGSEDESELITNWIEILGPDFAHQVGISYPDLFSASDEVSKEKLPFELQALLSAKQRAGNRLTCSNTEKEALVPLLFWFISASTRARKSGFGFLEKQVSNKVIPKYLFESFLDIQIKKEPQKIIEELEKRTQAEDHSGIALLERSLSCTWLKLLLDGAHPRIVFESLAGFFGSEFYPYLRKAMRQKAEEKNQNTKQSKYEQNLDATKADLDPVETDEPIDGSLSQAEVDALLMSGDEPPYDSSEINESFEEASNDASKNVLSQNEVDLLLNAVSEAPGDEPLPDSAIKIVKFITILIELSTDVNNFPARVARALALIAVHLERGIPRILSVLPVSIIESVTNMSNSLAKTITDPLNPIVSILPELEAALEQGELPETGPALLVELIDSLAEREEIYELLEESEPELYVLIYNNRFLFEDIVLLDDQAIQLVLERVEKNDLAMALKSVDTEVQERIFNNMPKCEVALFREDMENMGAVRLNDVEAKQAIICGQVLDMEREGVIYIARGGEEELVV